MTIVLAANLKDRNVFLADVFVDEGPGRYSTIEKIFPVGWMPDTFVTGLGDELFLLILKDGLGESRQMGWPPLASLDLMSLDSMQQIAKMATDYRKHLRSCKITPASDSCALYVVTRSSVARWHFKANADDVYALVTNRPEHVPEGYAFIDAGWASPPSHVEHLIGGANLDQLVGFVEQRSGRLPYLVGRGVTGVVVPHAPEAAATARCLCTLTVGDRTRKMRETD